jgi:Ca-activated chloride channel family protein
LKKIITKRQQNLFLARKISSIYLLLLFSFLFNISSLQAQQNKTSRILIILDASGSMASKWNTQVKFDLAKEILVNLTDSMYKSNKNIEFGLRVLGHQSPRADKNCKDSKLEVPFGKNNSAQIKTVLSKITPKGQTPIAYSLLQAAVDFPKDTLANHSIILITDGIETCDGNACDAAKELAAKRISVKPFVVGLGVTDSMKNFYKCVGTFYDVAEENEFGNVISAVVKQALNRTTVQVNLLDKNGIPTVTDIEFSLVDHTTGKSRYQLVHRLDTKQNPDTLLIDPKGIYDIIVHSIPSVTKENIELTPGKHNIIALDVPQGTLSLELEGTIAKFEGLQCIVRKTGTQEILYVQDFKTQMKYLEGIYDLEILSTPRIYKSGIEISSGKTTAIKIPIPGILIFTPSELGVASVFTRENEKMIKVIDFHSISTVQTIFLQPGKYQLIYRPDKGKQAKRTKVIDFEILSTKTVSLKS